MGRKALARAVDSLAVRVTQLETDFERAEIVGPEPIEEANRVFVAQYRDLFESFAFLLATFGPVPSMGNVCRFCGGSLPSHRRIGTTTCPSSMFDIARSLLVKR